MGLFSNKEEEVRRKRNLKELEDKRVRFAERLAAEGFRPEHCLFVQRDGGFVAVARHGGALYFLTGPAPGAEEDFTLRRVGRARAYAEDVLIKSEGLGGILGFGKKGGYGFRLIVTPEEGEPMEMVDMFTEAGIPFLFYNKEPSAETVQSVVVEPGSIFIGTTPREAGDMQGEILADMYTADPSSVDLNGDGVVHFVEFMGEPNNPEAIARTQYSEETAIALGVPLEAVLEDPIVANWDTAQANERMTATWAAHPEIEVVFCNNDDMATGVIAAMNNFNYNTGREGDPSLVVIGVDATDAAFEAIANGRMTATVKQDGDAMGYANVRIAVNYLQTGTWLDGLDYTLAEDGYSVRIPYAKITADEVE